MPLLRVQPCSHGSGLWLAGPAAAGSISKKRVPKEVEPASCAADCQRRMCLISVWYLGVLNSSKVPSEKGLAMLEGFGFWV